MKRLRIWLFLAAAAAMAAPMHAREGAVLRSGFTISHDHHRQIGSTTRLFLSSSEDEYVDMPTDSILSFEAESAPPPAAVSAPQLSDEVDIEQVVDRAAAENQLDADFIRAVIRAESNGKPSAVSPKGAQGLMQLMPDTASKLGVKNIFDPGQNVSAGTRYLRELLARYHNDPVRALAAYNAGAGRVQQYHGVPPYRETRAYVAGIIRDFNRRKLEQERATKPNKQTAQKIAARSSDGN
jgi:soluble lytic murein transglycosylase-like protein